MKALKQRYEIKAPIGTVWQALVDPEIIEKWSGGPAKMSDKESFEFSLWGGDIHGKNIKVVKNKELVQDWYGGDWDQPSKVTFRLSEDQGVTEVNLIQENVPDEEFEDIEDGWKQFYLGPILDFLENPK